MKNPLVTSSRNTTLSRIIFHWFITFVLVCGLCIPTSFAQAQPTDSSANPAAAATDTTGSEADETAGQDASEAASGSGEMGKASSGNQAASDADAVTNGPSASDAANTTPKEVQPAEEKTPAEPVEIDDDYVQGQLLITFKGKPASEISLFSSNDSSTPETSNALEAVSNLDIDLVEEVPTYSNESQTTMLAETPEGLSVEQAIGELQTEEGIVNVQPNYRYDLIDSVPVEDSGDPLEESISTLSLGVPTLPNDPFCKNATGWNGGQYYLYKSGVIDAWTEATCEGDVSVAVLDTGCRLTHEDLSGVIDTDNAWDVFANDGEGGPLTTAVPNAGDPHGHGTHVAGIVAGQTNNAKGIAGASYNAKVVPVKIFDNEGKNCTTATMNGGLQHIIKLKREGKLANLHVINISAGLYSSKATSPDQIDPLVESSLSTLRDTYGVLTVCAGGNGDPNTRQARTGIVYPSDSDKVLSVTSLQTTGANSTWSDYNQYKDISAYGENIYSTSKTGDSSYEVMSGTSMAAPLVSGVAALMFASNPSMTPDRAVQILEETADELTDTVNDRSATSGSAGVMNAQAAVDQVAGVHPVSAEPLKNADTKGNLVVLVRFAGDTNGDGDSGVAAGYNAEYSNAASTGWRTMWERLMFSINSAEPNMSQWFTFRNYLRTMSYKQLDVESYFPQTQNQGRVAYVTLSGDFNSYLYNDDAIIREVSDQLKTIAPNFDMKQADKNSDGYLDNLQMILVTDSNDFISHESWSDARISLGTTGKSATVGNYTMVRGGVYAIGSSAPMDKFEVGTCVHEFMHVLDVCDLYRGRGDTSSYDNPVGLWDIMASSGSYPWPLAFTRNKCGWYDIPEKETTGSYTLYAPGAVDKAAGKENAIVLKTPLSDSEYFVVEYRKKASATTDFYALDKKIGGSGLIVYRVNTAYNEEGNVLGKDNVYVFRQGETGLGVAAGDVNNAQVGTSAYGAPRQSIGSTDLSASITSGALCYSNGQNSGLKVDVTSQDDGSITFNVSCAEDYGWQALSNANGSSTNFGTYGAADCQVATDGQNTYMIAYDQTGGTSQVWKHDGQNWTKFGAALSGANSYDIACVNGKVYVSALSSGSQQQKLYELANSAASNAAWRSCGSVPSEAVAANIGVVAGEVYMMGSKNGSSTLYKFNGSGMTAVSSSVNKSLDRVQIVDAQGTPAVTGTWFDGNTWKGGANVYYLVNGVLQDKGSVASGTVSAVSAVVSGDKVYVNTYINADAGTAKLTSFDMQGNTQQTATLSELQGSSLGVQMSADKGTLYFCAVKGESSGSKCLSYTMPLDDFGKLTQLGETVYSAAAVSGLGATVVGDKVVCAIADGTSNTVSVRYHDAIEADCEHKQLGDWQSDGDKHWQVCKVCGAKVNETSHVPGDWQHDNDKHWQVCGTCSAKVNESEHRFSDWEVTKQPTATQSGTKRRVCADCGYTQEESIDPATPSVSYSTHVQNIGWQDYVADGASAGTSGKSLRLKAIKIKLPDSLKAAYSGDIQYKTHVQDYGWQNEKTNDQVSGTLREGKRLEAIQITLTGELAENFDIYYRVHAQEKGWMGWAKNGESAGTAGFCYRLEGIQIVLVKKGENPPAENPVSKTKDSFVHWSGHKYSAWETTVEPTCGHEGVQQRKCTVAGCTKVETKVIPTGDHDWQWNVTTPATLDKEGVANRTCKNCGEAEQNVALEKVGVSYRTHVQSVGWQNFVSNGQSAGTSGRSLRLEGIELKLSNGALASYSGDIEYRTHIQTYGWEKNWKKNGEMSGTSGESKRLEAIQIKLTGELADNFDVYYRVHAQEFGWMGWAKNGEEAGTAGYAYRLEAIQVVLVKKGEQPPAANPAIRTAVPFKKK